MAKTGRVLVSIVIPCFNGARWLADAIDAALDQTHVPREVIIVDDGSTDDSVAVARGYGARVQLSVGANQGPSAARNRGLQRARGEFVQFLDADDLLLPRKIEACLNAVSDAQDIPFTGLLPFRPGMDGTSTVPSGLQAVAAHFRAPAPVFDPTNPVQTALTFEIQTSQPLFPTALLRKVAGFRPGMRWLEDIDLNLRLVLAGARYVPVEGPMVLLRDHSEPGRQRLAPGAAAGRIAGEHLMMQAVRDAGAWSPPIAQVFADRFAYAGRQALLAGDSDGGRQALTVAASLSKAPNPTRVPVYNRLSNLIGTERLESWLRRGKQRLAAR